MRRHLVGIDDIRLRMGLKGNYSITPASKIGHPREGGDPFLAQTVVNI